MEPHRVDKTYKPLSIIGKGSGYNNAPYDIESWGATQLILKRDVHVVIDMNDYSNNRWGKQEAVSAKKAREKAKRLNIPYIDLKSYPIREIVTYFDTDYFTNTIDYMIALAVFKNYTDLSFYGVNMAKATEYAYQKAGVDHWCGIAKGKGCKINIYGDESTILKTHDNMMYGYNIKQSEVLKTFKSLEYPQLRG